MVTSGLLSSSKSDTELMSLHSKHENIYEMLLVDRKLKMGENIEDIGIPPSSVVSILNDHLVLGNLSARWVASLLTID